MIRGKLHNGAGSRNNYIVVQRATDLDPNDIGEVLQVYSTLGAYYAAYRPFTGKEFQAALTTQPLLSSIIELPYDAVSSTITPKDRVNDGGRIQNILLAYNEMENNEKMILWLSEPVAC